MINEGEQTEKSYKEQRIEDIRLIYYTRPDVKRAIYEFSLNREVVPRYFEGFGKRPDSFQFEGDIIEQVKRGATSFHCSEEIWSDVLEISTDFSRKEFDKLRIGWDLLLDIDSQYLEYSKIYTKLVVDVLKFHGVENVSVKFSGSKGFHIIVPWKAFPELVYNQETKEMFPEWPRIICKYIGEIVKPKLAEKIFENDSLEDIALKTGRAKDELLVNECVSCRRQPVVKNKVSWICECKQIGEVVRIAMNKRIPKCPECRRNMKEKDREEILYCEYCNLFSDKNPEMFEMSIRKTEILIDADLVLVAPRHLFRMPYSLHEKTSLASIVIDKNRVMDFQINDAKPLKVEVKNFYPDANKDEAKDLLLQALDWNEQKEKEENIIQEKKESISKQLKVNRAGGKGGNKYGGKGEYKRIIISNPSDEIFPPQIKLLLKGIGQDGRKRALMILISFFKFLGVEDNDIEKRIFEWNEKNYLPLKKGYIQSQLSWYKRNPDRLPPNFNNSIYRDLGVDKPDKLAMETKNPINYAVKRYFSLRK